MMHKERSELRAVKSGDADNMVRSQSSLMKPRRSVVVSNKPSLLSPGKEDENHDRDLTTDDYSSIIKDAHKSMGSGHGAFPQEWESHVFVDCGRTANGHRLVAFAPYFLHHCHQDPHELDRVFKFVLLRMDTIVHREKFIIVFCNAGSWAHSGVAQRFRVAYDIVPRSYSKNLKGFWILHPTLSLKLTLWSFWPWISGRMWNKIRYYESLDMLCRDVHPDDSFLRADMRRKLPLLIQREDAHRQGLPTPSTFGVRVKQLCDECGVEWLDAATGRWYPRLPPPVVLLCEALERQAADEAFCHMFDFNVGPTHDVVAMIEEGHPLDPEIPLPTLWCVLKLYLDCLPIPLLGFQTFEDLAERRIRPVDDKALRSILVEALQQRLASDVAQTTLFLASFFRQMSLNAEHRHSSQDGATRADSSLFQGGTSTYNKAWTADAADSSSINRCTSELLAEVFTPCFVKPRSMKGRSGEVFQVAIALVTLLIDDASDPDLWVGAIKPTLRPAAPAEVESESSASEDWDGS